LVEAEGSLSSSVLFHTLVAATYERFNVNMRSAFMKGISVQPVPGGRCLLRNALPRRWS